MTKNNRDQDVEFIKALAELLRENDLNELEVSREYGEDDNINVRVARGGVVAAPVMTAAPVAPAVAPVAAPATAAASSTIL